MNIDTDTQWAFWDGMREYEAKYHDYLQGQVRQRPHAHPPLAICCAIQIPPCRLSQPSHPPIASQIGNPEGATKPNKKYYDPRMPLRAGEEAMAKRLGEAMEDLNCINVL